MSRPPQTETNTTANRRGIIDFVGVPMNTAYYPADDAFMQAAYPAIPPPMPVPIPNPMQAPMQPPMGPTPVYTMAGYQPMMPQQPTPYVQTTYPPQQYMPAYPGVASGGTYSTYPVNSQVIDTSQRGVISAQQPITEEALQQKVDAKIESIMAAHKTDMLSQQITRLTDKVQKLSKNIEYQQCVSERPSLSSPASSSPDSDENEMSRRLRKLAAESSRRAHPDGNTHF